MSDDHPVNNPGETAPSWVTLPTLPWTRVVPQQRHRKDSAPEEKPPERAPIPPPPPPPPPPQRAPGPSAPPAWSAHATSVMPIVPSRPPAGTYPGHSVAGPHRHSGTASVPSPSFAPSPTAPRPSTESGETPSGFRQIPEPRRSDDRASSYPREAQVSPAPVTGPPSDTESHPQPKEDQLAPDPEQLLSSVTWRFDPETLREVVDDEEAHELRTIRDLLTARLHSVGENAPRARLLSLRAVISRILGDLHKALADGKLAVAHAEATGELRRIAIAQARLAHVLQWRGEYEEADRLFALANSTELPDRLRATMHQHAGKCAYDQRRYIEACNHFESVLELRKDDDPELIEQINLALDAVFRRIADHGWGEYPRTKEEILRIRKPPAPIFDGTAQRWGFATPEGTYAIGPLYTDAQPFRDGVAWVQRPGSDKWELINEVGQSLIHQSHGYLGVSSFSDGLAWVSRDGTARWIAIDKSNTVLIPAGFDDVRPFRRGLAAVRASGRWGAVDSAGRVVVPFRFDGFATAMHDGRYIDGFSDEGLAIVSLNGRKGVVDRTGRVIVPLTYHVLVIHPVAFLFRTERQQWGALDRRGRALIDPEHPSRISVVEEIDLLLADTRPML